MGETGENVQLSGVGDDSVVTRRNHDHGEGVGENRLVILTSEGQRTKLESRKGSLRVRQGSNLGAKKVRQQIRTSRANIATRAVPQHE